MAGYTRRLVSPAASDKALKTIRQTATNRSTIWPGCSTATSGVGSITTAATTSRLSTRRCDTSTSSSLGGRIGSSSPGGGTDGVHGNGSTASRDDSHAFSPIGPAPGALLGDGSPMRRELHVRFCERAVVRFRRATHLVVGVEKQADARRFSEAMRTRLAAFALSLHPEKTRLIEFGATLRADPGSRDSG
jgi:hypothetical protein